MPPSFSSSAAAHASRQHAGSSSSHKSRSTLTKRRSRKSSMASASPPSVASAEPFPPLDSTSSAATSITSTTSPAPKIKPYLRKMSGTAAKDDSEQGRLDLSKSTSETGVLLAGLGIDNYGARSAADVSFVSTSRRTHARTVSGGSQVSVGSSTGSFRPFVHPMRQTPRPFAPAAVASHASSVIEGEPETADREAQDRVTADHDFRPVASLRGSRSLSMTATAPPPFTPSLPTHTATAPDLTQIRTLPTPPNASQTNLSVRSGRSSHSRLGRPRRNTDRSLDTPPGGAPSSAAASIDRAISFVSRRSDPATADGVPLKPSLAQDERVRALRKAFDEKEAEKERKLAARRAHQEAKQAKRSERHLHQRQHQSPRRPSLAASFTTLSPTSPIGHDPRPSNGSSSTTPRRGSLASTLLLPRRTLGRSAHGTAAAAANASAPNLLQLHSTAYDDTESAPAPTLLPRAAKGNYAQGKGKARRADVERALGPSGRAVQPRFAARFSSWLQTRMLQCGRPEEDGGGGGERRAGAGEKKGRGAKMEVGEKEVW